MTLTYLMYDQIPSLNSLHVKRNSGNHTVFKCKGCGVLYYTFKYVFKQLPVIKWQSRLRQPGQECGLKWVTLHRGFWYCVYWFKTLSCFLQVLPVTLPVLLSAPTFGFPTGKCCIMYCICFNFWGVFWLLVKCPGFIPRKQLEHLHYRSVCSMRTGPCSGACEKPST